MTALLIGLVLGAAVGCASALWLLRWRASAADLSLTAQERAALEDIRRVRLDALRQLGDAARRGQGRGVTTLGSQTETSRSRPARSPSTWEAPGERPDQASGGLVCGRVRVPGNSGRGSAGGCPVPGCIGRDLGATGGRVWAVVAAARWLVVSAGCCSFHHRHRTVFWRIVVGEYQSCGPRGEEG